MRSSCVMLGSFLAVAVSVRAPDDVAQAHLHFLRLDVETLDDQRHAESHPGVADRDAAALDQLAGAQPQQAVAAIGFGIVAPRRARERQRHGLAALVADPEPLLRRILERRINRSVADQAPAVLLLVVVLDVIHGSLPAPRWWPPPRPAAGCAGSSACAACAFRWRRCRRAPWSGRRAARRVRAGSAWRFPVSGRCPAKASNRRWC